MGKFISVIGGLVAVLIGLIGLIKWWDLFVKALLATVPSILILGGLIALAAGISEIKDAAKNSKEESKEEKK